MFCKRCGQQLPDDALHCSNCGTPTINAPNPVTTDLDEYSSADNYEQEIMTARTLGIVSIFLGFIPFIGLICSILSLTQKSSLTAKGIVDKRLDTANLCAIIGLLISIVMTIVSLC